MRLVCLLLCAKCLGFFAAPLFAQISEPAFDPTPVSIANSSTGSTRAVTALDLLALRQVYGVGISPDGKKIAFVLGQADYGNDAYRSGLFVVDTTANGTLRCLGSAGTPHWDAIGQWISEAPQWSGDSQSLTYRMRMRGVDAWQIWNWNARSNRLAPLTHVPGDIIGYRRDEAARKLVLTVKRPADADTSQRLTAHGIHYDQRFQPWQGMPVILADLKEESRTTETWIHDLVTDEERKATEEERRQGPAIEGLQRLFDEHRPAGSDACDVERAQPSPDGSTVAFVCFAENTTGTGVFSWNLFVVDVHSGRIQRVTSDVYLVSDYWWSRDGRVLFYVATRGDGRSNSIQAMELKTAVTRTVYRGSDFLKQFSPDRASRFVACTRETGLLPPEIAVIDLAAARLSTRANLNPEFANLRLSAPERIAGINKYGEEWFGHLVKPLDYEPGKKYPLIVTTYRSGDYFLVGASGNENPIQLYAAQGFAVLSFDIGRLRKRREHEFTDRLLDWESPTESVVEAIDMLVNGGLVDPERIGISAFSHGAEIVEYAISHTPRFHAAILSGPAARDPYFYYMAGAAWQESFEKWGLGGWPDGPSRSNWKELAASLNADRIQTPLLVNASDSEYIASLALVTSLEQLKKPVDLYVYANELHVKNWPGHRHEIYERNTDWFRFWLKGEEHGSPGKLLEYKHWREMRENSPGIR